MITNKEFLNGLRKETNYKLTENGAVALKSTLDAVYDLFAFGGAYRHRDEDSCVKLFSQAFSENPLLALKCLFYLRDCRKGQGERRFFKLCLDYLNKRYPKILYKNLTNIIEFGRYDDFIDIILKTHDSGIKEYGITLIKNQLINDLESEKVSLLAKWMPSANTSSKETVKKAVELRQYLRLSPKTYQKTLSTLRKKINIVERQMSNKEWEKIEYDKIPSIAGFRYRKAFYRNDEARYTEFMSNKETKVNAATLTPYSIVSQCLNYDIKNRNVLEKYWQNLPNYFTKPQNGIAIVDVSGSMRGTPMEVAISLGLYVAERNKGAFKDYFITFSDNPELLKIYGQDILEKVSNISDANWGMSTNLESVFNLLLNTGLKNNIKQEDMPKNLYIISDMEINAADDRANDKTFMEKMKENWETHGYELPHIVYWNVDARNNTILDNSENVTLVSGMSPVIFEQVLKGVTGKDIMMDKLNSERYDKIVV